MYRNIIGSMCVIALAACESPKPKGKVVGPQAAAGAAGPVELIFALPETAAFDSLENVTEKVQEVAVQLIASDSTCRKWEQEKVRDFSAGKTLEYEIDPRCDWELVVALGTSESNDDDDSVKFQAFYQAKRRLYREKFAGKRDYPVDLEYERTAAGGTAGFRAARIEVEPDGGSFSNDSDKDDRRDEDRKDDDDNKDDDNNDQGNGSTVTYSRDLKPLLEASCTSCHNPRGSRATSPLTNFQEVLRFKERVVSEVVNATMPIGNPLSAAAKKTFEDWKKGNYAE